MPLRLRLGKRAKSPTWAVGWRDGDDAFLALGTDAERLPVYRVVGAIKSPDSLTRTQMHWPDCLHHMPYAEPVVDLVELTEAEARRYRSAMRTQETLTGP